MKRRHVVGVAVLAALVTVQVSSAETVITPFAGVAFGGATGKSLGTYGGAVGFFGRVAGFEAEVGLTPDFFGDSVSGGFFDKNDVVNLMGNLLLVVRPDRDVRVYGVVGAGLLKTRLEDAEDLFDVNSTDIGVNVGGGLIVYLGRTVGLRGDVRYLRSLSDLDAGGSVDLGPVDFWRVTGGISLRF